MTDKTIVLITGANTGIGFETVKTLVNSSTSYHIFLGVRSIEKGENAIKELGDIGENILTPVIIDVDSDESIEKAAEEVGSKVDHLDVLINNAGWQARIDKDGTRREVLLKNYNTNVAGSLITTDSFAHLLIKSKNPRLLFITSGLSSLQEFSDQTSKGLHIQPAGLPKPKVPHNQFLEYRASKAALNMAMIDYLRLYKEDGFKVWSISPGLLATGLGGNPEFLKKIGAKHPSIGGEFIRDVVCGKRDADVGKVIRSDNVQPF